MKSKTAQPFLIRDLVRSSWRMLIASPGLLLGMTALYLAFIVSTPMFNLGYVNYLDLGTIALSALISLLVTSILGIILFAGLIKIFLLHFDGEKPSGAELFRHRRLFWKFIFTEAMVGLIVLTVFFLTILVATSLLYLVRSSGLLTFRGNLTLFADLIVLLVAIPSFIIMTKLYFAGYISVDREVGPGEAISESWRLTRGKKWLITKLMLAMGAINFIASFANFGGLIISLSLTLMVMVGAYRALERHPDNKKGFEIE